MSSPPPLGLFSSPIPSLSEVCSKVTKFYIIWVWNVETQHLMHKVRGNYSSCTCRRAVKMYVAAVEALRKNERRVKTGWNSVCHKKSGAFLSLIPSSDSHLRERERESMGRFSKSLSLYVKTSGFHSKNQTETLKGPHWKSENCPTLIITCGGASKSKYLSLIWLKFPLLKGAQKTTFAHFFEME
jgi:hypothetical protein